MTSEIEGIAILKRDSKGRVRVPRQRQEELLDEYERSGLSGAKFAALCGVKYPSFANWVQRRRSRQEKSAAARPEKRGAPPVRWLEAVTGNGMESRNRAVVIHLPGGVRLEIADRAQVPLAVALLRGLTAEPALSLQRPC